MPIERLSTRYARLFEVRILHHYWLDDGATLFDALLPRVQQSRLLTFDVRKILELRPTTETIEILAGLEAIWRATSLGMVVGVKPNRRIPPTTVFEFTMRVVDPHYFGYSAYGLVVPTTATVFQTTTQKTFWYRSNAALYSNLSGASRGSGANKQLFLSREYLPRTSSDPVESIATDDSALVQLTSDPPISTAQTLGVASSLPVFAHHGDVPIITAPASAVGTVPTRGFALPEGAPEDTLALIRIGAVRLADADFSCTSGDVAKAVAPVFELRIKNRRTLWRYFNKSDPTIAPTQSGPFPRTYMGNPTTTLKPAHHMVTLDRSGSAITNIVSEIYQ
jgi:hypothetical protein